MKKQNKGKKFLHAGSTRQFFVSLVIGTNNAKDHIMKQSLILLACLIIGFTAMCQQRDWLTDYEKSGFLETPRYEATIDFCTKMARRSKMISYSTFGQSAQGRELPLLVLDRDGLSDPAAIRSAGRIILLLQACIHPGESDGKDAGLMLFRDFAYPLADNDRQLPGQRLLDHGSIIFIPILILNYSAQKPERLLCTALPRILPG